jgi:hypothetical protein
MQCAYSAGITGSNDPNVDEAAVGANRVNAVVVRLRYGHALSLRLSYRCPAEPKCPPRLGNRQRREGPGGIGLAALRLPTSDS